MALLVFSAFGCVSAKTKCAICAVAISLFSFFFMQQKYHINLAVVLSFYNER